MASVLTWLSCLPSQARGWASLTQVACPVPLLPAAFPTTSMTRPTRQGVPGLKAVPWVTALGSGACSVMQGLSQGPVPPGADVSIRNWGGGGGLPCFCVSPKVHSHPHHLLGAPS